ncbi:hypothetical protein [Kitasatospora sp. NPDC088134]|uniref:hypothetical protein n=1 Tax=Kitasatospora sp. NPDC088134 TaxID=3364071 RepID=UPI0037F1B7FC
MKRVFVLGAGFSRAISDAMPMLKELANQVMESDPVRAVGITNGPELYGGNVERWLSALADPGPWRSRAEALRDRSDFAAVAEGIAEVVSKAEAKAAAEDCPPWLATLVRYWNKHQSTVITFNYDQLVELAYATVYKDDERGRGDARDLHLIALTPADARVGSAPGAWPSAAFGLLKLHGSLSWWYSGLDGHPGEPIYFTRWSGAFKSGMHDVLAADIGDLTADMVPVIIPPVATKTPYYTSHLLTAQWRKAAKAISELGEHDELVLMGYSLPPTDLTVGDLISSSLPVHPIAIVPVNLWNPALAPAKDQALIVRNLRGLLPRRADVITTYLGTDPIPGWVADHAS